MFPRLNLFRSMRLLAAACLCFQIVAAAGAKNLRLHNETIDPMAGTNRAVLAGLKNARQPVDGVFLIQLQGPLTAAERTNLRAAGVELLQYVPEDGFVARLHQVAPATVATWNGVEWVGPYRKELKIHPQLARAAIAAASTNQTVDISILLAARATPAEFTAVRTHFAKIYHESHLRQGVIVRGELSPGHLDALAQSPAVLWLERAPKRHLVDEAAAKLVGGDDGRVATPTVTEQAGFNGAGVTVCVADTGLDSGKTNTMHPDLRGRVTGFQYYGDLTDGSDGYGHGTHCAGIVAGNAATGETDPDSLAWYGLGVASGASLFIERIFDADANPASPFPSDENLTQDAVRHGAKIGSNSWGNDVQGEYDLDCAQFDELVRDADAGTPGDQPYILEFSAGNAGPDTQTIGSPAIGKNVIATGASENVTGTLAGNYGLYADGPDTMCDFSSRGPCADRRIKPDLVAPGSWIASAASSAAPNEAAIAWTAIDNYYVYMGGTSMSGPHAAGAAAVFVQYYKSLHTNTVPSPALVKAALINSANELDEANGGPGLVPNNDEGWGRITLTNLIVTNFATAPLFFTYLDQNVLLTNSQVYVQHVFVQGPDQPLKITLAYTDVPGFPGALPALVNNLDLVVIGPDGTLYRGNQFGAGVSVPNAPTPDNLNNVEGVLLAAPATGDYQIQVRASKIVQDAVSNTPAIDQDFALVASGDLTRPGTGLILLDRPSYTAPGIMQLEVLDAARAASNTVSVVVTNLTEHKYVTNLLHAAGNYGAFTGAVATVTGTAGAGQLQLLNGDNLAAIYVDGSGTRRTATAVANLIPPAITSVAPTTNLGVLTLTWTTSEPANSVVHYGTNSANLNLGVTNTALVTSHVVKLTQLIPTHIYYYTVGSTDAAGNATTSNNSGADYTFTGLTSPTVLLVDAYDTTAEENNGATVIPDSAYTNVLNAAGITYAFWKVNARGTPQLADLTPYPVVMWRLTDDQVNYGVDADGLPDPTATNNTLNAAQQYLIQSYLNGGGSFLLASMGILSQLGEVPFRENILEVGGFLQNPDPPAPCTDCDEDFGVPAVAGAPATLAANLDLTLNYTNYPSFDDGAGDVYGPDFSDTFTPAAGATPITFETTAGKPCGMSYPAVGVESPGRVVFLAFPFDAMPTNGPATNNAISFLKSAIQFLAPGVNGAGIVLLDNSVYTTNDLVTVQVGDSALTGLSSATATFTASSRTNKTVVTLLPTSHPGLFTGYLTLVGGNAATNQLLVRQGDTVTATYFDAAKNQNVTATALVDTIPPGITAVTATRDYSNARVTWTTSKAADSSVQYSESPLPDRSVYASALVTNHDLTISGLAANRVYYYQVVSRDQAGNTTVDDNQDQLYTFKTLKAPTPPWFDNLEKGPPGWTVVPDPVYGSDINWQLGTPDNGLVTSAHSGTNAWSSNIDGNQNFFLASSYLYAPVIDLSGLQSATLTFWDVCDFSGEFEDGVVYVSTNSTTAPANLPMVMDFTGNIADDWQPESVDLTPFVGQTVQIVFYYEGVSAGSNLYGWSVDDIGITGVAAGGTINLTKNLGQGAWALSSVTPLGLVPVQTDVTPAVALSNLPAGQYTVQFGDVPWYHTPAAQTNTLTAGGVLNFNGNYTFVDANHNGISDAWEQYYFREVTTNRTAKTDTDHTGMSDLDKFLAGLDPTNPASRFQFTGETLATNRAARLTWTVTTNRLYQITQSTNLATWTAVTPWLQASNNASMNFTTTNNRATRAQFFRVQVEP